MITLSSSRSRGPGGISLLRVVLARPRVARLLFSSLLGRARDGGCVLAIVLLVREATGSFEVAGLSAGVFALAAAAARPIQGRLIDSLGYRRVLHFTGLWNALSLYALAISVGTSAGAIHVFLSAVSGALLPALSASVRSFLVVLFSDARERSTAYAIEASVHQVSSVLGPLLVAGIVAVASPASALVILASLGWAGTLAVARSSLPIDHGRQDSPLAHKKLGRSIGMLTTISVGLGVTTGAITVGVSFVTAEEAIPAMSGLVLAAFGAGQLFAGLWYGQHPWRIGADSRLMRSLALLVLFLTPLALGPDVYALMGLVTCIGAAMGPALITTYGLVADDAAPASMTEAFAWVSSASAAGIGIGTSLAGYLLESSGAGWAPLAWGGSLVAIIASWMLTGRRG